MLLIVLMCAFGPSAHAEESGLRHFTVFEDPAGTMGIEAVAALDPARFVAVPAGSFAGGYTNSAFWFRFTVVGAGEWWLDLLPPVIDDLRLYKPAAARAGSFVESHTGDTLPFSTREIPYRSFVFKLHHDDDAPKTYYLRMRTTSTSTLTPRLSRPDEFVDRAMLENGLLYAAFAIALAVILLNLGATIWVDNQITLWFMAFLTAFAGHLLGVGGYAQQYIFAQRPEWSFPFVAVFNFMLIATGTGFYRRLLGITRKQRVLYWLYEANFWLAVISLPFALSGYYTKVMPLALQANVVMIAVGTGVSVSLWWRGVPGGGLMLAANLFNWGGILIFVLNTLGVLTGGFFIWHSIQFSSLGSIMTLHIALSAHYRSLFDARITAEQETLHERAERQRQGKFLTMLGHELRTSLSVLTMALKSQPLTSKALASAERAVTSMSHVIDRSIEAQALSDGQFVPIRQPCDVAALLEEVIAESRAPERVQTHSDIHQVIESDVRLLRVILTNLVDNALKYSPVDAPVDVVFENGERLVIRFCNSVGTAGHPDPARVFEKYYRATGAYESTGSGLGLYVAQGMATLLGGELSYRSVGDHICFELRL